MIKHFVFIGASFLLFSVTSFAEPWMASRFSQNCASCHAPGRVSELKTSTKRCSFSCKSCHTNPNGGGLRNAHGKWLEERWLRSSYIEDYKLNKPRPAPYAQQNYQEQVLKNFLSGTKDPKEITRVEREGFKLIETGDKVSELEYTRHRTPSLAVDDAGEAKLRIPKDDPYRVTQSSYFNGGVDFRWFYLDSKADTVEKQGLVPMGTDVAASVTPFHHLTAVWESRFGADPRTASVWDNAYTTSNTVRSAYVLVDDLPYNSYAQYGIYMPMFGEQTADHTTLTARASGLSNTATFKTASIGTAGNFPFFNVNMVQPFENRDMRQDRGLVFNVGARFQNSLYIMLSWWDTKAKDYHTNVITSRRMQALSGGFTIGRLTLVLQVDDMLLDVPDVRRDSGTVISVEPRVRVWRETYLKGSWEYLNTAPTFRQGHAQQYGGGLSSFLVSGVEMELMYKDMQASELGVDTRETNIWAQAHLFF